MHVERSEKNDRGGEVYALEPRAGPCARSARGRKKQACHGGRRNTPARPQQRPRAFSRSGVGEAGADPERRVSHPDPSQLRPRRENVASLELPREVAARLECKPTRDTHLRTVTTAPHPGADTQ